MAQEAVCEHTSEDICDCPCHEGLAIHVVSCCCVCPVCDKNVKRFSLRYQPQIDFSKVQIPQIRPKREWVYVWRPVQFEMSPCDCGNADPDWSEYRNHLWCEACKKDYVPKCAGIFDGPIPAHMSQAMGICLDRIDLVSGKYMVFDPVLPELYRDTTEEEQKLLDASNG
jgi:hypothetical protein